MTSKPRLAAITPIYFHPSHSDVIVTRWLEPLPEDKQFGWPVEGSMPRTEIASLYIEQFGDNDIGREIAARHNIPLFSTIRDALTLGTGKLAVDGVLLIGEHGDFSLNEFGQKKYPRREYFDQIVEVFRESGRCVPVFSDKHFSYDDSSAFHMVSTAREMGFPLMGGSSTPLSGLAKPEKFTRDSHLKEAIGIHYDGVEAYGYHSIALVESIVAARQGGESGIESVTAYAGDSFWQAQKEGKWSAELFDAALQSIPISTQKIEQDNFRDHLVCPKPADVFQDRWPLAFCFNHRDGFRSTHINLNGHIKTFAMAMQDQSGALAASCTVQTLRDNKKYFYPHFATFNARIEEFILSGKSPYPVEHYLLETLAIAAAMRALAEPGKTIQTPWIDMRYKL